MSGKKKKILFSVFVRVCGSFFSFWSDARLESPHASQRLKDSRLNWFLSASAKTWKPRFQDPIEESIIFPIAPRSIGPRAYLL
jgi:hypothetical protein